MKTSRWLKKYFIPHEHNEHKPHFLRLETTVVILSSVLFLEITFLVGVFVVLPNANFFAAILPGVLVDLTNESRGVNHAGQLSVNPLLERAAEMKAEDMAARGYFSHDTPDGLAPWYWLEEVGYSFSYAGENLAVNFVDSEDVVDAWMKSLSHKENILNKHFTEIGIGIAKGKYEGRETFFVAQFFGRPSKPGVVVGTEKKIPVTISQIPERELAPQSREMFIEVKGAEDVGGVLAGTVEGVENLKARADSSFIQRILASPRSMMNYLYVVAFTIILLALMLSIFIKIKVQHPALIVNGSVLLLVVGSLLVLNQYLSISRLQIF